MLPKKLSDLVPEFLKEIPDPMKGQWIYDSKEGTIAHSAYPDIKPTNITPNVQPMLDMAKKAALLAKLREIRRALEIYMVEFGDYPKSLDMLVKERLLSEVPDPLDGKWIYDPKTGNVKHSLIDSDELANEIN